MAPMSTALVTAGWAVNGVGSALGEDVGGVDIAEVDADDVAFSMIRIEDDSKFLSNLAQWQNKELWLVRMRLWVGPVCLVH